MKKDFSECLARLDRVFRWVITQTFYRVQFREIGARSILYKPALILGAGRIKIRNRVVIRQGVRLECVRFGSRLGSIQLGSGTTIEQNCHIVSCDSLQIHQNVTIAPNVCIVGSSHDFSRPSYNSSYVTSLSNEDSSIEIMEGAFIGAGAVILAGTKIGRSAIVGANSVVSGLVPDFVIVAGNPAKIIKIFDCKTDAWLKPSLN